MPPPTNLDKAVTSKRSAHVALYADHPPQRRKEKLSASQTAQTEKRGAHLSQNDAHPSKYEPTIPLNRHVATRERRDDDHQDVAKGSGKMEQRHKRVDTRDIDSPRRYQSETIDEEPGAKSRLWCARCYKKKKCPEDLTESTKRLLERIKERSRECGRSRETVAGASTAPHGESISQNASKKSAKSRQQDVAFVAKTDRDASEKAWKESERERKRSEKEKKKRKERREKERRERRETERKERRRRKIREQIPADERADLVAEDRVLDRLAMPSTADPTKTCCYLCVQSTLAIATAISRPERSDKDVQVSAYNLRAPTLDRSGSPMLLMRTVRSSVKVRTREVGTLCPDASAQHKETKLRPRRKRFDLFSRLTRTRCPAGPHAACETERRDNADKHEPRNEKCCKERDA